MRENEQAKCSKNWKLLLCILDKAINDDNFKEEDINVMYIHWERI